MSGPANSQTLIKNETKVGLLVAGTALLALVFAWLVGAANPFSSTVDFYVTYNFAGGIEIGSPVRVSGIKVGRVEKIQFFVPSNTSQPIANKEPGSADDAIGAGKAIIPVRLKVSVRKDAAIGIREDSHFYINIAGIIGERYVEITPGSFERTQIKSGSTLAGIDPPRIDQLLSQSFDLAGKIKDIIDENKGDIAKSIQLLYKLSANINETLSWVDKSKIFKNDLGTLIQNLIAITGDVRRVTDKTHSPEGEKTLKLLYDLLWRLEPLDHAAIKKFFQEEGLRTHIF